MSKDRQQRREQQASVTKTGDQITVTAQPTSTGKDVEAAVAEFERSASEALERAPDRTPTEIIEHAERLTRGHGEQLDSYLARLRAAGGAEAEAAELRSELAQLQRSAEQDRERIQQLEDSRRAAFDELAEALKNGGTTSTTKEGHIATEQQREQSAAYASAFDAPKPPANIPKAVHHLRRAANALPPSDLSREAIVAYARTLVHETEHGHLVVQRWLAIHASALEMDAHGGAQAAKDVRAAIEALS